MIRLATLEDANALCEIYAYYVMYDVATFAYEVPSTEMFASRMAEIKNTYPYLVYEENGVILGYAYANQYRSRSAYQWDVELSVYIHKDHRGKQIAPKLYSCLFNILKQQGIYTAYACITSPNPASERLHKNMGFTLLGRMPHVGFKFDQWLDVIWMEKELLPHDRKPSTIQSIASLQLPIQLG